MTSNQCCQLFQEKMLLLYHIMEMLWNRHFGHRGYHWCHRWRRSIVASKQVSFAVLPTMKNHPKLATLEFIQFH